ncbi:MAG: O-antigen ligase family protein, partial [Halobacteriovoraceae bacterium]|nr:O-antigen ligase family protein [Halobacteriovoraceae bacterium]
SNNLRLEFFETAYHAFKERPFWGFGYRNFEPNVIDLKKKYNITMAPDMAGHAHNNFLEHLASTGIIGALAFLLFCLFWTIDSYKRKDIAGKIIFPVTISFMVSGMLQYTFGDGENLFLLMLLWAI